LFKLNNDFKLTAKKGLATQSSANVYRLIEERAARSRQSGYAAEKKKRPPKSMTCEKVNSNNCKVMVRAQGKEKELEKSAPIKNRILLLFFLLVLVLIISIYYYYYYYYYGSYLLLVFIIIIDWGIFDFRLHFTSSKR
jgi:hypothetical protein